MSNADCNAVYGIVSDGAFCVDTSGGRGSCNVSCEKQIQRKLSFHEMAIRQQLVLICERKLFNIYNQLNLFVFLNKLRNISKDYLFRAILGVQPS